MDVREVDRLVRASVAPTAGIAIQSHFDHSAVQVTLTVDPPPTSSSAPSAEFRRTAEISTDGVELFTLTLDGAFSHPEYEYLEQNQPELVRMLATAAEAHLLGRDHLEFRRSLLGRTRRILVVDVGPDWLLRISEGRGSSRGAS